MIKYSDIRSVHLEISTLCNASCPLCPRNLAGYDTDLGYPLHNMTLAEAKTVFTESFLLQLRNILINGNFGDFVMNSESLDIVKYFVSVNPGLRIEISSNGSARSWWAELGSIPNVVVGFALDGLADTHSLYRRNTNWNVVIKNAQTFIQAGGHAVWRMIKFDHNQHQLDTCRSLSKSLGFKNFTISDDGRDAGPVYSRWGKYEYKIGNDKNFAGGYPEEAAIWDSWTKPAADPKSRSDARMVIPIKRTVDCYTQRMQEIYITATGEVYPCCWLGIYPKVPFAHGWQSDNDQIVEIATANNALEVGVESAVNWFNSVEARWQKQSYAEGRLFKCDQYCGH